MISSAIIDSAVRALAAACNPGRIILFGSHARGDAREDSDVDLLVIEREVEDRAREPVRLRRVLRPPRRSLPIVPRVAYRQIDLPVRDVLHRK